MGVVFPRSGVYQSVRKTSRDESKVCLFKIRDFQKKPRVRKFFARNSGAGNGCANFMGAWKYAFFLQENLHAHQFLVLGGILGLVFFFLGGGAKCRFYFHGRGDFLRFGALIFEGPFPSYWLHSAGYTCTSVHLHFHSPN